MIGGGARVEGRTHRADDSPVVEARVLFSMAPVPLPDIATLSDDNGRFSLYAPAPGTYELECHADGLNPVTIPIEVDENSETIEVDVEFVD